MSTHLITYHFAHMDWPFIGDHLNLFVDFHLVYATVIVWLITPATYEGLDGLVDQLAVVERHPSLRPLFG
ncbi:MAG: hypothetical protein WCD87_02970 [Pseudolabrys sp.]